MKKLFLLSAISAIGAMTATAQETARAIDVKEGRSMVLTPTATSPVVNSTLKTTAPGFRTYDHASYIESTNTALNGRAVPIWQDTTIRQNFTSGLGTINYLSVSQVFFPFDNFWNDPFNPNFLGDIAVTPTNTYNVDSVSILGFYIRGNSPGAGAKPDSLQISVASQPAGNAYYWTRSGTTWAGSYLPTGRDTLFVSTAINVDSVRKAVRSNPLATSSITWTVPLDPAVRKAIDTATTFTNFSYKLPTSLVVPAGNVVMVSYTFRSGDTWNKNVDTITQKHHFRAGFGYLGTAGATPVANKQLYNWYSGDHNMSSLMFSSDSSFYLPTVVIGAINTPASWFNHYLLNTVTISCGACSTVGTVGINENTLLSSMKAFPNPSNENLTIEFSTKEKANVMINITNMMGQVVATQDMGTVTSGQKSTAIFSTSALPAGIYTYTINANGQKSTSRFSVVH